MKLVETWVKAPFLKRASLLLLSECAQDIFPDVCKKFAKGRVVLTSCPEVENAEMIMGKLTSILTCSNPSDLTVLKMEGSPHCFALHDLHLVQKCIQRCPDILEDLNRHSLEHRCR